MKQLWCRMQVDWQQCVQDCRLLLDETQVDSFLDLFYGGTMRRIKKQGG